jgi:hypothetical protein
LKTIDSFIENLHEISELHQLNEMKEQIKNQVMDPTLRWDQRMVLYKQVQLINDWVTYLQTKKALA